MYAIVAQLTYEPGQSAAGQAQLAEFVALRAQQPGYRGAIELDTGDQQTLLLTCWESQAQHEAANVVLRAAAEQAIPLLLAAPRQRLGAGAVVGNTIAPGAAPAYARLAEVTYAPGQRDAGQAQVEEYVALRAQQPGFRGSMGIDMGAERRLVLVCWASQAQFAAAQPVLGPAAARLLAPLFGAPARQLGDGAVVLDTLTTRA